MSGNFGLLSPQEQALLMLSQWQRGAMGKRGVGNGMLNSDAFDNLKALTPDQQGQPPTLPIGKPFGSLSPGGGDQVASNAPTPYLGGPGNISNQSNYNGPEAWQGSGMKMPTQGPQPMQMQQSPGMMQQLLKMMFGQQDGGDYGPAVADMGGGMPDFGAGDYS